MAQTSHINHPPTLFFFLKHENAYLGLYSISSSSLKLSDFFKKKPWFSYKFSFFKSKTKLDLDRSFLESNILPFDEIDIKMINNDPIEPFFRNLPIKSMNKEKIEFLIENILDDLKKTTETGSSPHSDRKFQASIHMNQNLFDKSRTCVIPEEEKNTIQPFSPIQSNNEKKLKHRIFVIKEFIKTEENYKKILFDLINNMILPCQNLNYLSKTQEKEIFSNIETIANFSEKFLSALQKIFTEDFDSSKTLFAETIVKMQPFFRFYYPYCINYKDSRKVLEQIRKENQVFNQWLKTIEMNQWDKGIDSILIEPVQRLPRYVLLMIELKKNTFISHPDYIYIEKALKTFAELNNSVNKNMEEYLKTVKLFDLEKKYGRFFTHELIDPKRKFLLEESMTMISDGSTQQVTCYFLSDMLLVTEHQFSDLKLIKSLHFDTKSYVYDIPNGKHYTHLITIFGEEEGLTFILDSNENKTKIIQFINKNIIKEIKEKQDDLLRSSLLLSPGTTDELLLLNKQAYFIEVAILGSVKRGLENILPFMVYFIRIRYGNFLTDLFLRYRELRELDDYVRKSFPQLKVLSFPKKKMFHHKTKTIEERKFDIENFLRVILNSDLIKENPERVLKFLNLPYNFYELFDMGADNSFFKDLDEVGEKLLRRFSVFRILYDFFQRTRPIYSLWTKNSIGTIVQKGIEIEASDGSKHLLYINKFTKALDLCYELAQKIGLISWLDYKLVLEKGDVEERIIDDDEFVCKALNIDDIMLGNSSEGANLFKKIVEKFQKGQILIKELFLAKYRLKWRKCIYMNNFIENIDYCSDSVRLDLMAWQAFEEIAKNKYDLSMNDYCLFAGIYGYIMYGELTMMELDGFLEFIHEKIINKIVPIQVFIKENAEVWIGLVVLFWKKLGLEIGKIIESNSVYNESNEESIMKSILNSDTIKRKNSLKFKINDGKILARMMLIKYLMNSELYGTRSYLIVFKKYKKNENDNKEIKKICKIFIKYDSLKFFDENNQKIEEILLKNIVDFMVFPDFVEISVKEQITNDQTQEKTTYVYRIYSSESIRIYRSLELYSQIEKLTLELNKIYLKKLKQQKTI